MNEEWNVTVKQTMMSKLRKPRVVGVIVLPKKHFELYLPLMHAKKVKIVA